MRSRAALPEIVQGVHVAEEDSPVLKQRMKGGIKGEIMEERGKCQPERREQHTCCPTLKQTQPFPFSHPLKTFLKIHCANRADIRLRHRKSGREGVRERWGVLQQSKGMQERERQRKRGRRSCDQRKPVTSLHSEDWSAVSQPPRNHFHWMEITCLPI